MPKQLQLSIPEPCHEDWDKMTQADKGRFCGACQKQVVDFTSMSDAQLVAFFKKKPSDSVCGRFMPEQLDKSMDIPRKRIPWVRYFFQLTLPLFLASLKTNAQKGKVAVKQINVQPPIECKKPDGPVIRMGMIARNPATVLKDKEIMGSVIGVDDKPVPYASVIVRGTINGVQADSNGFFKVTIPAKQDSAILTVSSVGYENKEVVLTAEDKSIVVVIVQLTEVTALNGAVVVTGYSTVKGGVRVGGVWSKITVVTEKEEKPDFSLATTTVYPNPLPSGESVNIKCEKVVEDYYTFQLMTTGGQQVFQKEIWIDKDAAVLNIQLPKVSPGMYFIVMTGRQHRKRFTDKIVIQ